MMKTDHHVHFGGDADNLEKDNNIVIQNINASDAIGVHLGFLQIGHRYHITFTLPISLCPACVLKPGESMQFAESPLTNPNCHVLSITMSSEELEITVEFFAYKEKLMKEELVLCGPAGDNAGFKLVFHARVLGRGKGTPLLRTGIRCVNVELEDESEASDWQGFD